MSVTVKTNFPEFQKFLREHLAKTSRSLPVALNSRMLHIVAKASKNTPKTERSTIEQELGVVGYALKFTKKGKYSRAQSSKRRADAAVTNGTSIIHLIINSRLGRVGKKGLYGAAMREAVTKFLLKRFRSVGTLKAGWTGAMRQLGQALGLTFRNEGASASVKGKSTVSVAKPGFTPSVRLEYTTNSFDKQHRPFIDERLLQAVEAAFQSETQELKNHGLQDAIDPQKQTSVAEMTARVKGMLKP